MASQVSSSLARCTSWSPLSTFREGLQAQKHGHSFWQDLLAPMLCRTKLRLLGVRNLPIWICGISRSRDPGCTHLFSQREEEGWQGPQFSITQQVKEMPDVTRAVTMNAWEVLQTSGMSLQPSSGPQRHRQEAGTEQGPSSSPCSPLTSSFQRTLTEGGTGHFSRQRKSSLIKDCISF